VRIRTLGVAIATLGAAWLGGADPAVAAKRTQPLLQYVVKGDVTAEQLAKAGYDMQEAQAGKKGFRIVATPSQAARLDTKDTTVTRLQKGKVSAFAAPNPLRDPGHGYNVFRPWSLTPAPCPGTCTTPLQPLKDWYDDRYSANRDVVRKVVYGKSRLGQDLVAYRMSKAAGQRPVVLFNATQHAREWIAAETNRRLFEYMLDHKRDASSGIPQLLSPTEVWFVPIVNPDGYDYTFVSPDTRMWRKNLRDNNEDGQITVGDGVDTNRNWPTKWRFDPEGASDTFAAETYRGPSPASEPEVSAYRKLMLRLRAKFMIDYHSYGELILYPEGWQVETEATDGPLLTTLAGHDELSPAIPGYDPDVSAELYTTNGDITDDALTTRGT
jgi:murein tripeptide amidase MpaA